MLEGRKRLDEYARSQIRNLLSDLKNAKHSAKLQAIKKFQTYLTDYEPEVSTH